MTTQIIPFAFEKREVRTLLIDDQPWFFAIDVCLSLTLSDTNKALVSLDEDEKCEHEHYSGSGRKPILINESGLYSLIFRSRKPEAKRFKKWVTAEVLPSIRRQGRYDDTQNKMALLVGDTIGKQGHDILSELIKGKVSHLRGKVRTSVQSKLWAQFRKAFSVEVAADLPQAELQNARQFIASYALEGEYLPSADLFTTNQPNTASYLEAELKKIAIAVDQYYYKEFGTNYIDGLLILKELHQYVPSDVHSLLKQLEGVLVSGWTHADESLCRLKAATSMLERWRGPKAKYNELLMSRL